MNRAFLKLAKNIACSNFSSTHLPYKLTLIVTYRCCLRCALCNIWQREPCDELTVEEYDRFFAQAPFFSWVNVSGGEIFLRDDIVDVMNVIIKRSKDLYLLDYPTSGFFPDRIAAATESILGLGPRKMLVTISIDGPQGLHDELRGVPGAWQKALATYRQLKKITAKNFDVYFGVTLSQYNQDRFDETFNALREAVPGLTYKDIHINLAHHSTHYYANDASKLGDKARLCRVIDSFKKRKGFPANPVLLLEWLYLTKCASYLEHHRTPVACKALQSSCFVGPVGDVFACGMYEEKIGSLRECEYDLKQVLAIPRAAEIRERIRQGACPQCWTPCEAYQSILGNLIKCF